MNKGRINSEVLGRFENFKGVNTLAVNAGFVSWKLKRIAEQLRAQKEYELSDELRELHRDLDYPLSRLFIHYQPPESD